MQHSIPILALTSSQFCERVFSVLHKGRRHAEMLYKAFFQEGVLNGVTPSLEPQAEALMQEIRGLVELQPYQLLSIKEEKEIKKFVLSFKEGGVSESVVIPMQFGTTLCVSSQVGCKMGCAFCETGKMGLLRNLTAEEILSQVFFAKHHLKVPICNLVFMGMGEPFDNYENVMQALRILTDPKGFGFGKSRITVSTSGLVDGIYRFCEEKEAAVHLAVSVNAPDDEIRKKIMPVNERYELEALKQAMLYYCNKTGKEILIEYVLLEGINASIECAEKLIHYLEGLSYRINLIPYNAQSRGRFLPPDEKACHEFFAYLKKAGKKVFLRKAKGNQIMAACGQLGSKEIRRQFLRDKNSQPIPIVS